MQTSSCPSDGVVWLSQFKDKARQKARVKKLAERQQQRQAELAQGVAGKKQVAPESAQKRLPAAKRRLLEHRQDESDFADEYRLLKKLKRGKLTEVCRWLLPSPLLPGIP